MTELSKMLKAQAREPRRPGDQPSGRPPANRDAETFNLIARSLLNVSDQIPSLVRDGADLKADLAELKNMIWQLGQSVNDARAEIAAIARTVAAPLPLTNPAPRMKLAPRHQTAGAPTGESLREALNSIPGVDAGDRA